MPTHYASNTDSNAQAARLERTGPRDKHVVHYELIAASKQAISSTKSWSRLANELGMLCFETEAAALTDDIPRIVIHGIYSHDLSQLGYSYTHPHQRELHQPRQRRRVPMRLDGKPQKGRMYQHRNIAQN